MGKLAENRRIFNLPRKVIKESRVFCGRLFHTATVECLKERDDVAVREMLTVNWFCVDEREERTSWCSLAMRSYKQRGWSDCSVLYVRVVSLKILYRHVAYLFHKKLATQKILNTTQFVFLSPFSQSLYDIWLVFRLKHWQTNQTRLGSLTMFSCKLTKYNPQNVVRPPRILPACNSQGLLCRSGRNTKTSFDCD